MIASHGIFQRRKMYRAEPKLTLYCLGTGRGATAVYGDGTSSAAALLANGKPILLIDAGFGVVRACTAMLGGIPDTILVTHNHSDHAGELPVILSTESKAHRCLNVIVGPMVAPRLREHRLHELTSTGHPLADFCDLTKADGPIELGDGITIELLPARHSEPNYGFILRRGDTPLLAYGGDSGFCETYYRQLFAAPTVVLDARAQASAEHAGFDEVAEFLHGRPDTDVRITGYGVSADAPATLTALKPGDHIALVQGLPA